MRAARSFWAAARQKPVGETCEVKGDGGGDLLEMGFGLADVAAAAGVAGAHSLRDGTLDTGAAAIILAELRCLLPLACG